MSLIKRYIFWTEPRGSLHYDVMVTLILAFIFITPRFIDYKDKPAPDTLFSTSEVLVRPAGHAGAQEKFVYEVRKEALHGATGDDAIRAGLLRVIQPIAGDPITLTGYQRVLNTHGQLVAYDATVLR
jgi:hypothetical protein